MAPQRRRLERRRLACRVARRGRRRPFGAFCRATMGCFSNRDAGHCGEANLPPRVRAWRLSLALPGEDLAMHISDARLLDAACPPADEPYQRRPAWWTALATLVSAAVPRVFAHPPGRVDRVDVRRRRDLDAAGGMATANARFTLGDPATDGLDFLLGGRLPRRRRGTARRTAACAAIMVATLAGAVALSATGNILPGVEAGPGVDAGPIVDAGATP